jgi:tetratricopeptide (TPR) repeat protein/tRNA A-37 threonylcarbamoyl transferase component Bud32
MSSSSTTAFAVNCPACGRRLRFPLDPDGPPRIRVRCAACDSEFGVRRPGAAPLGSTVSIGGAGGGGARAVAGGIGTAAGGGAARELAGPPTVVGVPVETMASGPPSFGGGAGGGMSIRPPVFAPGAIVAGRYRVVRFLAQGGMGEVYEVDDLELRERVALKTVRPEVAADFQAVDRFRREIQLARKVTHPNVCRIFDVSHHRPAGASEATIFLTMELLTGETLAERLRRDGPLPLAEALPVARQICLGLAAAHQVGVVHRDLKPGNVFLVTGRGAARAVVTDFGLARLESGHDPNAMTLTTAGGLVGTPAYLAPEQLEGGEITTAVDIYALGIVLYEMATGTVPFVGDSVLATAVKRLKEVPVSPRVHAPHLDGHWEAAILRCLERDPAARFASPLDVAAALAGTAPGESSQDGDAFPAQPRGPRAPPAAGTGVSGTDGTVTAGVGWSTWSTAAGGATGTDGTAAAPGEVTAGVGWRTTAGGATGATGAMGGGAAGAAATGLSGTAVSAASSTLAPAQAAAADGGGPPAGTAAAGGAAVGPNRRLTTLSLVALIVVSLAIASYRAFGWYQSKVGAEQQREVPSAEVTPRRSVAVLGFRDLSGAAGTSWLSPALAEMLSTELGAGGGLRVIGGEEVARVRMELKLGQPDSLARDTLVRLRTLLGSDAVILGSYLVAGAGAGAAGSGNRQIRLDMRLQDALTGETTTLTETGTEAGLFQLVTRAGANLRRELRAPQGAAAAASHPALAANPGAARLYAEGLERLRSFDPVGARDLLAQAVAADPGSALAHSGLAAAWAALGNDGRARGEAKTALDLAASLPEEERLLIEGRYREATGEWTRAAEIYRRLLALAPDSLDAGLRLAAAETGAGRPQDALATVATLRRLPEPQRDDPRIDLAEATAAAASADFQRQEAAAARAARSAGALGASLLVAQARLLDCLALRNLGRAEEALAACAEGQRLHAAAGDRSGVAEALTDAANVHFDRGDLAGALSLYQQALATYREIGNRGAEGRALNNIAVVLRSQGDLERARQLFEQVLAIAREIGSRGAEGYALNNLAGVLLHRGDLDGAAALYQQALVLWRELGDAAGEASALDNLGVALRRRGELAAARERHEQALAIRRRIGQKIGEAASLYNLGSVLLDQGDLTGAERDFQQALATSRAAGSQTSTAYALFWSGEALARQGRLDEARRDHEAALGLRTGLGEKGNAAESRLALAELNLALLSQPGFDAGLGLGAIPGGNPEALSVLADQAEAVAQELGRQGASALQARALSLAAMAANGASGGGNSGGPHGANRVRGATGDGARGGALGGHGAHGTHGADIAGATMAAMAERSRNDIDHAMALLSAPLELSAAAPATLLPTAAIGAPAAPAQVPPRPTPAAAQDLRTRLLVTLRSALLQPPARQPTALSRFAAVRDEATRKGLLELRLEAELAEAAAAGTTGSGVTPAAAASARERASALEGEARARGFALIAARAAALARPAQPAAAAGRVPH